MLEMNTQTRDDILLVELEGALDSRTSGDFKAWIEEKIIEGYRAIALDCQSLDFISSNGIAAILDIRRILVANHGAIALLNTSPEVKNLLGFLRILEQIPAFESLDALTTYLADYHKQPTRQNAASEPEPEPVTNPTAEVTVESPALEQQPSDLEPVLELPVPISSREPTEESVPEEKNSEPVQSQGESNSEAAEQQTSAEESSSHEPATSIAEDYKEAQTAATIPEETASEPQSGKSQQAEPSTPDTAENIAQVITCPNCGTALRVMRPAKYLCPACRCKFHWPQK